MKRYRLAIDSETHKLHMDEDDEGGWIKWFDIEAFVVKATEELQIVERTIGVPSEALKLISPLNEVEP